MKETITQQLIAVQQASREIITLTDEAINSLLLALADSIPAHRDAILEANQKDIERMDPADPMVDRLLLNASRLDAIAADIRNVA
jgi:glutamate-5-semialdehyde dehydrogenase